MATNAFKYDSYPLKNSPYSFANLKRTFAWNEIILSNRPKSSVAWRYG